LVAEHAGELVGFVTSFLSDSDPATLFVWQLGVRPDFRGIGLSDRLLDRIAESARTAGAAGIEATIEDDNAPSRAAFVRLAARLGSELQKMEEVAIPSNVGAGETTEDRYRIPMKQFPRRHEN
jgi:L-2,4-diaminobutyric acid acetyltransferase